MDICELPLGYRGQLYHFHTVMAYENVIWGIKFRICPF